MQPHKHVEIIAHNKMFLKREMRIAELLVDIRQGETGIE